MIGFALKIMRRSGPATRRRQVIAHERNVHGIQQRRGTYPRKGSCWATRGRQRRICGERWRSGACRGGGGHGLAARGGRTGPAGPGLGDRKAGATTWVKAGRRWCQRHPLRVVRCMAAGASRAAPLKSCCAGSRVRCSAITARVSRAVANGATQSGHRHDMRGRYPRSARGVEQRQQVGMPQPGLPSPAMDRSPRVGHECISVR